MSFKNALQKRRCLVIADGFYEWKRTSKKSRIPYRIQLKGASLFAFAGLWEEYEDEDQNRIHTFSIITTSANPLVSKIHDRMPAILDREKEAEWLASSFSTDKHLDFLKSYDERKMESFSVSSQVNAVENDNPRLILPAPSADQFGNLTLFD